MRKYLLILTLFHFLSFVSFSQERFHFSAVKMGSPFELIIYSCDSAQANKAAKEAFALVDSFNLIFSDYIDSSEISHLARLAGKDQKTAVSPPLFELITISKQVYKETTGAFNIAVGPLSKAWRDAGRKSEFLNHAAVKELKRLTNQSKIYVEKHSRKVELKTKGMSLDFGGIAKGYISQKVFTLLQSRGLTKVLINAGGDIVLGDPPPGETGWKVGLTRFKKTKDILTQFLILSNCAITTSGDLYRYTEYRGKRYSHIIDPRTGYGVTNHKTITVIAKDATEADWLSTSACILPRRKTHALLKKHNAFAIVVYSKGNKIKVRTLNKKQQPRGYPSREEITKRL